MTNTSIEPKANQFLLASQGQRFLNLLIDITCFVILHRIFSFNIGYILGWLFPNKVEFLFTNHLFLLIAVPYVIFVLIYYTIPEAISGKTFGKLLTKTKAVNIDSSKLTFGQALGRTLCRHIPFEAFSFLGGNGRPRGWHDRITSTMVITLKKPLSSINSPNTANTAKNTNSSQLVIKSPVQPFKTAATLQPPINEAMQEEDFWAQALEEFEGGHRKPGIWAKFYSESEGNESQAKAKYLKYRAEQLYQENIDLSQLKRSAEEGDADAMFNLGLKYENGQGLKQDYAEAIRWFRKAAELGNAASQNNLAWLYATCKDSHYLNGMAAVKYALQAVNNDPNDYDGYDSLAAACARNSKFEKAIELMQKAINLLQNDGTLNSTDKSKALARFNMRLGLYLKQQPYTDDGEAF